MDNILMCGHANGGLPGLLTIHAWLKQLMDGRRSIFNLAADSWLWADPVTMVLLLVSHKALTSLNIPLRRTFTVWVASAYRSETGLQGNKWNRLNLPTYIRAVDRLMNCSVWALHAAFAQFWSVLSTEYSIPVIFVYFKVEKSVGQPSLVRRRVFVKCWSPNYQQVLDRQLFFAISQTFIVTSITSKF